MIITLPLYAAIRVVCVNLEKHGHKCFLLGIKVFYMVEAYQNYEIISEIPQTRARFCNLVFLEFESCKVPLFSKSEENSSRSCG